MDTPNFKGMVQPFSDMAAALNQLRSRPFFVDVDLSAARTAAAPLLLPIVGNCFYVDQKAGGGVARIHFQDPTIGSTPITVCPGFKAGLAFTQIAIENDAQAGTTMRIVYGTDLDFNPGTGAGISLLNPVSVIDGAATVTKAGMSFLSGYAYTAALAANYSYLQLWNPVGSGRNAFTKKLSCMSTTGGFYARFYNTAMATLIGNAVNKKNGGAVSSCEIRGTQNAAALGTTIDYFTDAPNKNVYQAFDQPIELTPGTGLILSPAAPNFDLTSFFDFYEESA